MRADTAFRKPATHVGRGSQEGIFGELKSQNQMDYVPSRIYPQIFLKTQFTLQLQKNSEKMCFSQ